MGRVRPIPIPIPIPISILAIPAPYPFFFLFSSPISIGTVFVGFTRVRVFLLALATRPPLLPFQGRWLRPAWSTLKKPPMWRICPSHASLKISAQALSTSRPTKPPAPSSRAAADESLDATHSPNAPPWWRRVRVTCLLVGFWWFCQRDA